ncbi:hypothetical protein ACIRQF_00850 [Streptomyces sp. NPDC101191]|uniref:hypothetical protein n=1 Tax=Streptomyces sp. NPDC101191 TaxID=3366126 RepID=UPI0038020B43
MLTYWDVLHAPVDKLKTAVDDWSAMASKLALLAADARDGMQGKADKADWAGVNAEVSQAFIRKVAKEFDDAAKEAKGMHQLLLDGYTAFKKAKDALQAIVDGAEQAGIVVDNQGLVTARYPVSADTTTRHDPDTDEARAKEKADLDAWTERIRAVVAGCTADDESLRLALAANVGDPHDFTAPTYTSLDAEEAQRAYELALKGANGRPLTHAELQQLNQLLAANQKSVEFTTSFYEKLGPKGTLDLFAQMSTDTYTTAGPKEEQLKDVQDLQRNLGLTLATATDPDSRILVPGGNGVPVNPLGDWSAEFRRLGTQKLPLFPGDTMGVYGYQALAGILRYGDYDPRFLNPIAGHVVQLHEQNPHLFADNKRDVWQQNIFNPSGLNGAGYDPLTGVLEALGHSPEASKRFFTEEPPTAYDTDGTLKVGARPDLGKEDGRPITNYLDYFAREGGAESFPDVGRNDPHHMKGTDAYLPSALGHALEAATLGHAWDDPQPVLAKDETTAKLTESVIDAYGDAKLLKEQEALAESMGRIGAGYIDDLQWAVDNRGQQSVFVPHTDPDSHARVSREDAVDFLTALGQHPDAYEVVSVADQVATTARLDTMLRPDAHAPLPDQGPAQFVIGAGAQVQGLLDHARAEQIKAEGEKAYEEYEKAHEKMQTLIELGTGALVGAGVAALPATTASVGVGAVLVPVAMDSGAAFVEQTINDILGKYGEEGLEDKKESIEVQIRRATKDIYLAGERHFVAPVDRYIALQHLGPTDANAKAALLAAQVGYLMGTGQAANTGNPPQP